MRFLFCAGEASGDAYAAALIRGLRVVQPRAEIHAVGGRRCAQAGVTPFVDSTRWAAIGILESLRIAPRVLRDAKRIRAALRQGPPGVFVPIDFGYLNVKLAAFAKSLGWKVLYFAPPGSWRREKQGADLPTITDLIVTQFSWSAEILRTAGADARWYGHPLVEMIEANHSHNREWLAVLPGSRTHEATHNVPVIAEALEVMGRDLPIRFAVAPSLPVEWLRRLWAEHSDRPAEFITDRTAEVLQGARAGIVCSGTATLEAAICGCPCVVMYRGSKWMEFEYRLRKPKFQYISLPNILLDRPLLPELIQWDATPERVGIETRRILDETPDRALQLDGFRELVDLLGPPGGISRTVEDLVRLARG